MGVPASDLDPNSIELGVSGVCLLNRRGAIEGERPCELVGKDGDWGSEGGRAEPTTPY